MVQTLGKCIQAQIQHATKLVLGNRKRKTNYSNRKTFPRIHTGKLVVDQDMLHCKTTLLTYRLGM